MSSRLSDSLAFLLVSAVWGATNPLLQRGGSAALSQSARRRATSGADSQWAIVRALQRLLGDTWLLFTCPAYVLPWLVNMTGSVLYYATLSHAPLALASVITNSLTFCWTALAAWILLGERVEPLQILGVTLIVGGVGVCVSAS